MPNHPPEPKPTGTKRVRAQSDGRKGGGRVKLDRSLAASVEAKKALLRQSVARLLSQRGIGNITLRDVSLESGFTGRAASYYYRDIDELVADALGEHLAALDAAVCAAFDATLEAASPERMTALLLAFLTVALNQRDAHRALRLNTRSVSEARRSAIVGRSRQVIATLREALCACVPGLDVQPAIVGFLVRQVVGGLSDAATWFKEDDRVDRIGFAQLIASQTLMVARAAVEGSWVLPAPAVPSLAAAPPGEPLPAPISAPEPDRGDAIWLTPEQARRSLTKLVQAANAGTEVVLTHRGWPAAKLVPALRERERLRRVVGTRVP